VPGGERRSVDADWYEHAFGDLYSVLYAHRTVEAAAPEAAFAAEALGLRPGHRLLDLCCGSGRHLVHFARMTDHAVGLDYSRELLFHGRAQHGAALRAVRADMRAVPFAGAFDAVTNFFTSLGYFKDDAENMQVIAEIAGALKPSGRFFIDYVNAAYVRATLEPLTVRSSGGYAIEERRWIDERTRRLNKTTRVTRGGAVERELGESVRLYDEEELRALLEHAGLRCECAFGDYTGTPPAPTAPRLILTGPKCR